MNQEPRGLRDRQKEQRQQQILAAAGKLFTDLGFDETTMEDVAREAVVSVPTVYTYFSSKSDLLFALFETDENLIEPCVEKILANPPEDPVEAVVSVELAIVQQGYDIKQKRVWREISAAAFRAADSRRSDFIGLQSAREDWLRQMLELLKKRKQVRKDLDCAKAARTVYAIGRNSFRMYIMNDRTTEKQLEQQIRDDIGIAFQGMKGR